MKVRLRKFYAWLLRQTTFVRYLVIAILLHAVIVLILGSVKIATKLPPIGVFLNPPYLTPPTQDSDKDGKVLPTDDSGGTPGSRLGGIITPAGRAPADYHPSLPSADQTAGDKLAGEIIGRYNGMMDELPRVQGGTAGMVPPTGGFSDSKIGTPGISGTGTEFNQRFGSVRDTNNKTGGGNKETEKSVVAALRWLKDHQAADGSWSTEKFTDALSALAVLAFLGHGETADSEEFGPTVSQGIAYVAACVGPNGIVKSQNMYAQGTVTLALAEAYGMTQSPNARAPLEKAVAANLQAQTVRKIKPIHVGGWRYTPQSSDADTSVTGWLVMGLKSARLAGIAIPDEAFAMASKYFWNMYSDRGGFGYAEPGQGINTSAVGILCQQFMGHGDDQRIKKALDVYKGHRVDWERANHNDVLYGWYYVTQAMFQAGGAYWTYWNKEIRDTTVKMQAADGHWDPPPNSGREKSYGPVYSTTLCCLTLEVYYRYLPLNQDREHKAHPIAKPLVNPATPLSRRIAG